MPTEVIDSLIEGGKATAAPPLGPALGPLGVNIGEVVAEINKKTAEFKGMQVPVKVEVDTETKAFTISVGTPPASALIKKEANITKGSGNPLTDKVADLKIEQIIKISKMKEDALLGKDYFSRVKEIIGTCDSMGVLVEGTPARDTIAAINKGQFKEKIAAGKTELTAEELKVLEEERQKLQKELEEKRSQFENEAKKIIETMSGKSRSEIKSKMVEAKIPAAVFEPLLPAEEAKEGAAPVAKPADGAKPEAKK